MTSTNDDTYTKAEMETNQLGRVSHLRTRLICYGILIKNL